MPGLPAALLEPDVFVRVLFSLGSCDKGAIRNELAIML